MQVEPYLADEELIARTLVDRAPGLRLSRPARVEVVLGRGSRPERELVIERCLADGVPLLARRGGGCAVLLDPGQVLVSVALPLGGLGESRRIFEAATAWLVAALGRLGLTGLGLAGISDLAYAGRKVGGACIFRRRGLLLYSASLLVTPRVDLMERYLLHPPREPEYRARRSHAEFVLGLGALKRGLTAAGLEVDLRLHLDLPTLPWEPCRPAAGASPG